mgnify:FL=1
MIRLEDFYYPDAIRCGIIVYEVFKKIGEMVVKICDFLRRVTCGKLITQKLAIAILTYYPMF